jgi:FAD/FMN-containing dehydrogenase
MVEDGVVPRPLLPAALKEKREIIAKYKLNAGLIFHAGDGNLHPNIIFDERDMQEVKRVKKAGYEILRSCIRLGGSISGEHGIGVEKRVAMNWMYDIPTLDFFGAIKAAFDPKNLANPDKILPVAEDRQAGAASFQPSLLGEAATVLINELKLRRASGEKSAVTGLGTRDRRSAGGKPRYKALDTTRLNRILELDQANFTVRAEAGVPVRELRKWLKKAGFSIALPDMEGTLGGLIAAKAWAPARDILLGMDVALADGSALSFGGKTVKNVAGYDVMKLFCGSLGAYGVILTLTLRTAFDATQGKIGEAADTEGPKVFTPDEYHRRLKKAFDPQNLLNPWIYEGQG